jgi:hypothetical protein
LVGTGETINPNGYVLVNELDLNTCRSKVESILNSLDISQSDNFMIKRILKNHYGFATYEEMFKSVSQSKNISEIGRILDICRNKILENRTVDQNIQYGSVELPKQLRIPKGKFSTFTYDGIYSGDLQFDEDGERMCFMLLTKKGYKVFRNHGLIKIPYLMDGKYYTYEPDFIGFDLDNKISALDRKGKTVPVDQKKSIPFKSEAAEKLGYSHYIVTEDTTLNMYTQEHSDSSLDATFITKVDGILVNSDFKYKLKVPKEILTTITQVDTVTKYVKVKKNFPFSFFSLFI